MKIKQAKNMLAIINAQHGKHNIIHYPFTVQRLYDGAVVISKHDVGRVQDTYQKLSQGLSSAGDDAIVYYANSVDDTPARIRNITLDHFLDREYYEEKILRFLV